MRFEPEKSPSQTVSVPWGSEGHDELPGSLPCGLPPCPVGASTLFNTLTGSSSRPGRGPVGLWEEPQGESLLVPDLDCSSEYHQDAQAPLEREQLAEEFVVPDISAQGRLGSLQQTAITWESLKQLRNRQSHGHPGFLRTQQIRTPGRESRHRDYVAELADQYIRGTQWGSAYDSRQQRAALESSRLPAGNLPPPQLPFSANSPTPTACILDPLECAAYPLRREEPNYAQLGPVGAVDAIQSYQQHRGLQPDELRINVDTIAPPPLYTRPGSSLSRRPDSVRPLRGASVGATDEEWLSPEAQAQLVPRSLGGGPAEDRGTRTESAVRNVESGGKRVANSAQLALPAPSSWPLSAEDPETACEVSVNRGESRRSKRLHRKVVRPSSSEVVQSTDPLESRQPRFARLATTHLLRRVFSGAPAGNEPASNDVLKAVLSTECKRQKVLRGRLLDQMRDLACQLAAHDEKTNRVAKLLAELDEMRSGSISLLDRVPEILQIAEDLNDARCTSPVLGSKVVGHEFGQRCRAVNPFQGWLEHCTHTGMPLITLALAYGAGHCKSSEELIELSLGSLAGVPCTLRQMSELDPVDYRRSFVEYTEAVKGLLQTEDGEAPNAANLWQAGKLMTEWTVLDHLFYLENPTHFCTVDPSVWTVSEVAIPQPTVAIYVEAVRRTGYTESQRRALWQVWDVRNHHQTEARHAEARLRSEILEQLHNLQNSRLSGEDSASYSCLLTAVGKLRKVLNELAVTNSYCISSTILEISTPAQIATLMSTMYPYIINPAVFYECNIIERPKG